MLLTASFVFAIMADSATPKPTIDKNDPDKMICRRQVETGSLVKARRICFTRKRWTEIAADARRETETMQDQSANATRGN